MQNKDEDGKWGNEKSPMNTGRVAYCVLRASQVQGLKFNVQSWGSEGRAGTESEDLRLKAAFSFGEEPGEGKEPRTTTRTVEVGLRSQEDCYDAPSDEECKLQGKGHGAQATNRTYGMGVTCCGSEGVVCGRQGKAPAFAVATAPQARDLPPLFTIVRGFHKK